MNFPDPSRLLTLSTGSPGLRGSIHVEISQPRGDEAPGSTITPAPLAALPLPAGEGRGEGNFRSVPADVSSPPPADRSILDFVSSDETLDRYSEIISASGWRLDAYRKNPVFQNAHQYGDIIFTLGKALITEVRQVNGRSCLYQRIEFAVDANPIARIAYALYSGHYLNTVSVGFIPIRWQDFDTSQQSGDETLCSTNSASPQPALPLPLGEGRGEGDFSAINPSIQKSINPSPCRRRYLEQELLEVSAVAIPANPNALALALKSGAIERATLAETLDLLRSTPPPQIENQKSKIKNSIPPIPLSLIHDLHRLLTS